MSDTENTTENAAAKAHEDADTAAAGNPPALYRGIVIDVIYDPALYDPTKWMGAAKEVAGKDKILKLAPRNSCIVKILNDATKEDIPYTLCFPFFSPHLALPLKPGEQVWVFLENPDDRTKAWGYWMSRVHGPDFVDDVNFTHLDRAFEHITAAGNEQQSSSEEDPPEAEPSFPNGDDSNDLSLSNGRWEYERLYLGSLASHAVTYEAVPRFTKRPGDLVIMGSNNTLICLGEERANWTTDVHRDTLAEIADVKTSDAANLGVAGTILEEHADSTTGSAAAEESFPVPIEPDAAGVYKTKASLAPGDSPVDVPAPNERFFMGTIDIVAGRARWLEPETDAPDLTQPRLILNSRGQWEVDKNPTGAETADYPEIDTDDPHNRLDNPTEGDPDFLNDAARIYVSMNTLPDFNFGIEYPEGGIPIADDDANAGEPVDKDATPKVYLKEFVDGVGQAAIILKSDEIRIIARQDTSQDPPIQGSITLLKEGVADDEGGEGRGIITIRPDGVIMIDGPKVVIGSGLERGPGEGNQFSVGVGATEPMLLGDMFIAAIDKFTNALATDVETSIANLGAPVIMPALRGNVATLLTDMEDARSKVAKLL
jgi:hypothetical protein